MDRGVLIMCVLCGVMCRGVVGCGGLQREVMQCGVLCCSQM